IGFSPKSRGKPEYDAFGTSRDNSRDSRDEDLGRSTYGDRRVACFRRGRLRREKFQKLGGSPIRAKFVGMEMTDNVHWADVFCPNGSLKSYSVGREVCVDRGKDDAGCRQVWLSGKNVELRRAGWPAASEGVCSRQRPATDLGGFTRVGQMKT